MMYNKCPPWRLCWSARRNTYTIDKIQGFSRPPPPPPPIHSWWFLLLVSGPYNVKCKSKNYAIFVFFWFQHFFPTFFAYNFSSEHFCTNFSESGTSIKLCVIDTPPYKFFKVTLRAARVANFYAGSQKTVHFKTFSKSKNLFFTNIY